MSLLGRISGRKRKKEKERKRDEKGEREGRKQERKEKRQKEGYSVGKKRKDYRSITPKTVQLVRFGLNDTVYRLTCHPMSS